MSKPRETANQITMTGDGRGAERKARLSHAPKFWPLMVKGLPPWVKGLVGLKLVICGGLYVKFCAAVPTRRE